MAIKYQNLFKLIGWICFGILIGFLIYKHLLPFAISLMIAIAINPLVQVLEDKLNLNRRLAVISVLLLMLLSFITVITFSLVELIHLLQYLTNIMPASIDDLFKEIERISQTVIDRAYSMLTSFMDSIQPQSQVILKEMIAETVNTLKEYSQHLLINALQQTINTITNILKASYYLLFILISTFFISADGPKWLKYLDQQAPNTFRHYYITIKTSFISLIKKYALAQSMIVMITGALVFMGLTFFNINHALALASIAMFLDLIPFIGISALFLPWIIYLFFTDQYSLTIQISILYLLLIIIRNLIEPKLIGSSIGVHPLFLIIILFLFINWFGIFGVLLGPIAAVSFKALGQAGAFTAIKNYIIKPS
ncbi:sporulation integral membrane protein YtvI [Aquisalibacillus elongatus]|uniref:Sporulation integral membrane protein YtvI n=1 Tax=Aquisalibacillus elongatus TaxID=485577 RepID=A0A3N5BD19_9BACI|nr:sporulation integral membrane protein YtvI [Aquisalibacillus elongatus]RPF55373.1 sporulation integral membrane protein YtvI [Aquisalibacillus elongatus]